jgi:hypothetical protein
MSSRFRHEDREAVPAGWKVRTVKMGTHRARVAFPPGRKVKGSGRLVSILHPVGENPCELRSTNPAELMVMSANNPPRSRKNVVHRVVAVSRNGGANFEKTTATKEEARKVASKVDRSQYFQPHVQKVRGNPAELLVMAANPRVEVVHGDNPPVEEITEEFSGTEVKWLDVYNEPHIPRGRYAYLAKLFRLLIKPAKGGQVQKITFSEENAPIIVSDASAKQIYFVAGNQDVSACLEAFGGRERTVGTESYAVELGEAREIHYIGKKHHIGDEDTDEWRHKHGEEDGALPTVLFDTRNKRLLYEGGNYRIEGPWIHN